MTRRKPSAAIRGTRLARPVRWLLLAVGGAIAGLMLGELVAGGRIESNGDVMREGSGYAGFSANPDALVADGTSTPACLNCADSYGASARLRARRAEKEMEATLGEPEPDALEDALPEPAPDSADAHRIPDAEPAAVAPSAVEDSSPGGETEPD